MSWWSVGSRKFLYLMLIALIALCVVPAVLSLLSPPGIFLSITFYDEDGPILTPLRAPILTEGRVYVKIYAMVPPSVSDAEIKVWSGFLANPYIFLPYSGKFKEVVDEFRNHLLKSPASQEIRETMNYGLRIDLWIIDENGTVTSDTRYVTYSPLTITEGSKLVKYVEVHLNYPLIKHRVKAPSNEIPEFCRWKPEWVITPEDLVDAGAPFTEVDAVKYVETPLIIVKNPYPNSGIVHTSIGIYYKGRVGFAGWVATAYGIEEVTSSGEHSLRELNATMFNIGFTVEAVKPFLINTMFVPPNDTVYFYVYSRPYTVFEREVCYLRSGERISTGYERVRTYVGDYLINGTDIVIGRRKGFPQAISRDLLNEFSAETRLDIKDQPLAVGESIPLGTALTKLSNCSLNLGLPVNVGLMAASACEEFLGGECSSITRLVAAVPVSLDTDLGYGSLEHWLGVAFENCGSGEVCFATSDFRDVALSLYVLLSRSVFRINSPYNGFCVCSFLH